MTRGRGGDVSRPCRLREGNGGGLLVAVVGTRILLLVLAHGDLPKLEHPLEGLVKAMRKKGV
jgi:hypothetical protein